MVAFKSKKRNQIKTSVPLVTGGLTSPKGELVLALEVEAGDGADEGGVGETAIGAHLCRFGDL